MRLFVFDSGSEGLLLHIYNPWMVALSFLIATVGSSVAIFVVMSSSKIQSQRTRQVMLWSGAIAFGLAVWSMHFVGMLALSLCTSVSYNTPITVLSAIPAILSARLVLHYVARKDVTPAHLLIGGVVSGAGIGLMHYSGMMAMQLSADLRFDPTDFAISIISAVVLATIALGARGTLIKRLKVKALHASHLSAIIMGLAITTTHYRGMAAARFIGEAETPEPIAPVDGHYLAIMIAMAVVSILGLVASGVLLTKLRDSLSFLKVQGDELEAIIENSVEGIVTILEDGRVKSVNRTFQNLFGYTTGDLARQHVRHFLPEWSKVLEQTAQHTAFETLGQRKDGSEFPIEVKLTRLKNDLLAYYVGFISDLSDVKRIQDQLIHDANHDFLTGLNNRRFLEDQLNLEFNRRDRTGAPLSLIILDIDHFKQINDTHGHITGDKVLAMLSAMLQTHSRSGDILSRYGGEEFVLLLPNTDLITAMHVAERLRSQAAQLVMASAGSRISFTISLGVASTESVAASSPKDLIREADMALYQAKKSGRNRVEYAKVPSEVLGFAPQRLIA